MASIVGAMGRFVPVVMVVVRGNAIGAWSFSDFTVLQSILSCTVHRLGESDG
jgi:hypothetical protein